MSCTCFKDRLEKVKAHVQEQTPDDATELEVQWEGYSYFIGGDYSPVNPRVNTEYRPTKKDGTPAKSLKKQQITIVGDYCPFCGRKLKKNDEGDKNES